MMIITTANFLLQRIQNAVGLFRRGRYVPDSDDLPLNRMFHYTTSYFWTDSIRNIGIFTFPEEDYVYAVVRGTDLVTNRK